MRPTLAISPHIFLCGAPLAKTAVAMVFMFLPSHVLNKVTRQPAASLPRALDLFLPRPSCCRFLQAALASVGKVSMVRAILLHNAFFFS